MALYSISFINLIYISYITITCGKMSKAQFTEGLHEELSIRAPWANVDSLWRRIMEEYPDETSPVETKEAAAAAVVAGEDAKKDNIKNSKTANSEKRRPSTTSPTGMKSRGYFMQYICKNE
jgi:hypothetical protein